MRDPDDEFILTKPSYTPTDWENAVAVCEAFGAKVVLRGSYGKFDWDLAVDIINAGGGRVIPPLTDLDGLVLEGTLSESGDWEPMISIPISEYEELMEIKSMYEDLCK